MYKVEGGGMEGLRGGGGGGGSEGGIIRKEEGMMRWWREKREGDVKSRKSIDDGLKEGQRGRKEGLKENH